MNQHPRNQHFLMALMQDLEEASTALKEHRETLETATSEAEARHQWFSMFNLCGFDKHPTPFWMVAPSNAPSLGFRGLTQPKQNIKITSSNNIGIVTLDWNAVSKATNNCWAPGSIIAAGARLPGQGQELHRQAQECCSDSEEEYCDLIWLYDVLKSFRTHASNKLYNLYMCSWGSGIKSKVSANPWPAYELKPKNEKWSAWAILSGLSERGCGCCMKLQRHRWHIRGFWEIWACCQDLYVSTSRWKGLLRHMADIYDVKNPAFLKQSLHRKRFQKICDLELVVSACGAGDLLVTVCRCALGFSKSMHWLGKASIQYDPSRW